MLAKLKSQFYSLIKNLDYNITDNSENNGIFPWLKLRTNGYGVVKSFNVNVASAILVLDIFSTYSGEKEIIEIVETIGEHLQEIQNTNPEIMFAYQKTLKILDDNSTGPVRKHGVVVYEFLMGYGIAPKEEDDDADAEN